MTPQAYVKQHAPKIAALVGAVKDCQDRANTAGALVDLLRSFRRVQTATGATLSYFLPSSRIAATRRVLSTLTGNAVTLDVSKPFEFSEELDRIEADIQQIRDEADTREDKLREFVEKNRPPVLELKLENEAFYNLIRRYL
ncbi:MAG: hypothetical protein HYZ15_13030 [Sphingobacteriales bacterium]|nr:hypothetical protein [Sphingobacteriales bacterium]